MTEIALLGLESGERRRALAAWLRGVVEVLAPKADELGVRFVADEEMRSLNRRYRGVDRSTDVLSFPGETTEEGRHLGDIVISIDTAKRQAAAAGIPLDRELRELLLHGILHCLGHDHETDDGAMDELELELRARFVGQRPAPAGATGPERDGD